MEEIDSYFEQQLRVTKVPEKLKNLLIIKLEGFEDQALGIFNKECPQAMKFLSQTALNSTITMNARTAKYIEYTSAALFTLECNFPPLYSHLFPTLSTSNFSKCVGNILKGLGYHLEHRDSTVSTGWYDLEEQIKSRGYHYYGGNHHTRDAKMMEYVRLHVLPELAAKKEPWDLFIQLEDTHLLDPLYYFSEKCDHKNTKQCKRGIQAFDCDDQYLKFFFRQFEKLGLEKNTKVILFGDHVHPSNPESMYSNSDRKLLYILPFEKKRQIHRRVTAYDLAPTILDMLGIEISPKFLFGHSLLDENDTEDEENEPTIEMSSHIFEIFEKTNGLRKYKHNCSTCLDLSPKS